LPKWSTHTEVSMIKHIVRPPPNRAFLLFNLRFQKGGVEPKGRRRPRPVAQSA
jgi:hypothetical protein